MQGVRCWRSGLIKIRCGETRLKINNQASNESFLDAITSNTAGKKRFEGLFKRQTEDITVGQKETTVFNHEMQAPRSQLLQHHRCRHHKPQKRGVP